MRLLFVVDGRSPIAVNWINYIVGAGHEVHLVSTYPCESENKFASIHVIPIAFSSFRSKRLSVKMTRRGDYKFMQLKSIKWKSALRHWLGPVTLIQASKRLKKLIDRIQPDLIHAMRIPFEGMLAGMANPSVPLLVSVWGNDFTLHAQATRTMAKLTQKTLKRIDAIHSDCQRDLYLAYKWGFEDYKPTVVLPGGGGVQLDIFYPADSYITYLENICSKEPGIKQLRAADEFRFTVNNPRGFRAYIRNDIFFQAIPRVVEEIPHVKFICPNMVGEPEAEKWVNYLGIGEYVDLLPFQSRQQMAEQFRKSRLLVSPSLHDGTPNTLLEGMACGCFPVMGDIESIREWIDPGINGLLFDPNDPKALADAIILGLTDEEFICRAFNINLELIAERAEHHKVMNSAIDFYRDLVRE